MQGGGGGPPLFFLENWRKYPDFWEKLAGLCSCMEEMFYSKCCFKSIY